jgi:hypothetical protein
MHASSWPTIPMAITGLTLVLVGGVLVLLG